MKRHPLFSSLGLVSLLFLAACIPSVNPLYTQETIVFRPELLGVWKEKPESEESWNFTKAENNAYTLVIQEKDSSSPLEGYLVKLGDTLFLDLFPTEDVLEKSKIGAMYRSALIPGHLIVKVTLGKTLQLQMLNPDRFTEFLGREPKALAHALPDKERVVITASTDELQKFFKKHADTRTLWGDPGVFQKIQL
jgi:hypothetical protein